MVTVYGYSDFGIISALSFSNVLFPFSVTLFSDLGSPLRGTSFPICEPASTFSIGCFGFCFVFPPAK